MKIADYEWNPWVGCTFVGPGCENCLARARVEAAGLARWGDAARVRSRPAHWEVARRAHAAYQTGRRRPRVAVVVDCDFFAPAAPAGWRAEAWALVRDCPNADFLVWTRRPENVPGMLPPDWGPYPNVWLGVACEDGDALRLRADALLAVPAVVHVLVAEPLLGPVFVVPWLGTVRGGRLNTFGWVVAGSEAGPRRRPCEPEWPRLLELQCHMASVPFLWADRGGAAYTQCGPAVSPTPRSVARARAYVAGQQVDLVGVR